MPAPRQFLDGLTHLSKDQNGSTSKAAEVEDLLRKMNLAMNTADFSKFDFENNMAAEYTSEGDHHLLGNSAWREGTIPLSQRLAEHKAFCEKYPNYRVEMLDWETFVDDRGQTADVFLNCKIVGMPEAWKNGEGVMVLRWVWRKWEEGSGEGRWVVVKGTALRGSAGQSFA